MKIPLRVLTLKITFPGEKTSIITIDRDSALYIGVQSAKHLLQIQNEAQILIRGMRPDIRQLLLSSFTAWNYRKRFVNNYAYVEIFAGYESSIKRFAGSRIFIGDIVVCKPEGEMPNVDIAITAYTRMIDRTDLIPSSIPNKGTFKSIASAAAKAAGMGIDCKTSIDNRVISNFGVFQLNPVGEPMRFNVQAAIAYLNAVEPDKVVAWVDDDKVLVRDIGEAVGTDIPKISTFVGNPPIWTEWGITFTTLFTPQLRLGGAFEVDCVTLPKLNGQYVTTSLAYNLTSRERPFYVTVKSTPPAAES